ncbi:MAG: hypothetical protein ABIS06_16575 [Vicinamibacterales bacterium]
MLNTWILWWNTQALPLTARWWSPPVFFPASGAFALSEHLLGISVFTAPLQRAGLNAVGCYNVALILSYWLSGFFGFLLARRLTGSSAAGLVAGVAYACAPYRAGQLSHLQVLTAQWMPLALLAMHAYLDARRRRWLAVFAAAWLLQALSNGYYLLFFPIYIGIWLAWFVRWKTDARAGIALAATFALSSLLLIPTLLRYREVHDSMGLSRSRGEMVLFSAHLNSLWQMPELLRLWPDSSGRTQEDFLFPGVTCIVLVLTAILVAFRSTGAKRALSRRSPLVFYVATTLLMWWLAMGPAPDHAPAEAFVRPYTWLTVLPGFSGLRAPSRFAMLACLSLSIAAALAVRRITSGRSGVAVTAITGLVVAGLLVDGWTDSIPLRPPPGRFELPAASDALVVELPLDDSRVNIAAMYRAMLHGRPLLNGYSGHTPPHFRMLETAIRREDPSALQLFSRGRPLIIVVHGKADESGDLLRFVRSLDGIEEHGSSTAGSVFVLRARARGPVAGVGEPVQAAVTPAPLEHAVIDLGRPEIIRTVAFPVRWHFQEMGARFAVEASDDGAQWTTVWYDWTAALAIAGALEDQKEAPFRITLPDVRARYLRVHPAPPWLAREIAIYR